MARRRTFGNFFTFRWMITPGVIRLFYVLGLIIDNLLILAGIVGGIVTMVILSAEIDVLYVVLGIVGIIIVGIIILILWNLVWRMMCEGVILFFSMHEMLSTIEGDVKERMAAREKETRERSMAGMEKEKEKERKVGKKKEQSP